MDIASLGPVVMLSCMYAASAIHKLIARRGDAPDSSAPWLDGTAVAEALACCEHQKALGRLLLQSHSLCRALTWLTVALECAAPVGLLLCDGAARFALLLALLGFHGVLHLTLELCNFSVVCAALLCICVPAAAWDAGELFIRALWGAQATATPPPKAVGTEGPPAARSNPAQPNASARRLLSAQPLSAGLIGLTVIGAVVTFPSDTEPPAPPAAGLFGTGVPARTLRRRRLSWRPWRHPWWRQLETRCATLAWHRAWTSSHCRPTTADGTRMPSSRAACSVPRPAHNTHEAPSRHTHGHAHGHARPRTAPLVPTHATRSTPPLVFRWVLEATLSDGSTVDAHKLRHQPGAPSSVSTRRPHMPSAQHGSMLWQNFYERLSSAWRVPADALATDPDVLAQRSSLALYHCARLPSARSLRILFVVERIAVVGAERRVRVSAPTVHELWASGARWCEQTL